MNNGSNPNANSSSPSQMPYRFTSGDKNERTYAILAHVTSAAGYIGIPMGNIVGPMIMLLVYGKISSFVEENSKESLNFQISLTIYAIISAVLSLVLVGFLLLAAVIIFGIVEVVIASVKAGDGDLHRYPLCIRFVK
jgi:uncharacterized protein